jgi:hypothetical protein
MRRWRSLARAAAWRCVRTGICCGEGMSSLARAVATNGCAGSATERRSGRARHAAWNSRRRAPTPSSARARVGKRRIARRSPLKSRASGQLCASRGILPGAASCFCASPPGRDYSRNREGVPRGGGRGRRAGRSAGHCVLRNGVTREIELHLRLCIDAATCAMSGAKCRNDDTLLPHLVTRDKPRSR